MEQQESPISAQRSRFLVSQLKRSQIY